MSDKPVAAIRLDDPPVEHYHGAMTDSARWRHVELRDGDILICTPPKCGTTWTQSIVAMLVTGSTDVDASALTPWIDANITPIDEVVKSFEAMPFPRFAKTHTPLDGVPVGPSRRYITVYRHPIDALLSVRKHIRNMTMTEDDHPYLQPLPVVFDHFMTAPLDRDGIDEMTLAAVAHHYACAASVKTEPNVLMLHYADMTRDPHHAIRRIAAHLSIDADRGAVDAIVEATSFSNMKAAAERFAPHAAAGIYHDPSAFFDSGASRKWEGQLDAERIARLEATLSAMLDQAMADWLMWGDGPT